MEFSQNKKININFIFSKNFLLLVLILLISAIFFFLYSIDWLKDPYLTTRDAYSFYQFDFSSIESIFSKYRSFGGPLFVSIYKFFSPSLNNWAITNFMIYSLSLVLLFLALCKYQFNKIFSFLFIIGVLGQTKLWPHFGYFSEVLSISLLNFTMALFFFSITYKKIYLSIFFAIFLFLTYQTRPLLLVFVGFFIVYEFSILYLDKTKKIFKKKNLSILFYTLLPLILFLLFRLIVTGHIGIAPYVGAHLGSHALMHVEKNKLSKEDDSNIFLKQIIERREKHEFPCNLNFRELKELKIKNENYQLCFFYNTMSLMIEIINQKKNKQPFNEGDPRNYNSWEYVDTLDKFFMSIDGYNEIDQDLKSFAIKQIKKNPEGYIEQFKINFFESYKNILGINWRLVCLYLLVLVLSIFIRFKGLKLPFKENDIRILAFSFALLVTNFVSFFLLNAIHIPQIRLIAIQGVYLVPMLGSLIIYLVLSKLERIKSRQNI
jgi:hypothetical protein